jgi:hypothetical protein
MGWDVTPVGKNITTRKYVEHYIKTSWDGVYETVKIFEGKNLGGEKAFYVALKKIGESKVFACVILTRRKNGSVAVKVVGESAGPGHIEAPANFIYLLSPTDSVWANEWRANCINRYISTKILKEDVA